MPGNQYTAILLFLFSLWACHPDHQQDAALKAPDKIPGFLSPPTVVPAGQPLITQLDTTTLSVVSARGKPLSSVQKTVQPAASNTRLAGKAQLIRMAEAPPVFTPGENGLPLPKKTLAKGRSIAIQNPELVPAQEPDFRDDSRFNIQIMEVEQGLSASSFLAIEEDRRGNMWFGSVNGGFSRYDGRYFAHFTSRQGLNSDQVHDILEDTAGNIWLGMDSYGGIIRFDGKNYVHFGEEEGITTRVIYKLLEDRSGNIWFTTEEEGVIRYDGRTFTHFTTDEGLSSNDVFSIAEDHDGNIWFGTENGGACKFDGQRFTHYYEVGKPNADVVSSILVDTSGNIWFGTVASGIFKYDGEQLLQFTTAQGLNDNIILDILEDRQGKMWFATRAGGVNCYDGTSFTYYTMEEGLTSNTILSLENDRWGNIWLGTEGGGICKFTPGSFRHITQKEGLKNNPVRTITEDRAGNVWLGTQRGDISRYGGDYFTHYLLPELGASWVISSMEDRRGNIWFGTFGSGIFQYDPDAGQFTQFSEAEGLSSNNVEQMLEDSRGNLWFSTFGGGVNKFDGTDFTYFTEKDGLPDNAIITLFEDSGGDLWFASFQHGVCRYDGDRLLTYTTEHGLSHNTVRVIFEDSRRQLWFGTEGGGVNKFDGQYFTQYQLQEGLGDNHIRSIYEDQQGNFWFSTMDGLFHVFFGDAREGAAPSADDQNIKLIHYGKSDGLKAVEFLGNSFCQDREEQLWWGTEKGITILSLDESRRNSRPPLVHLNQLDVNQNFVDYADSASMEKAGWSVAGVAPFSNFPNAPQFPHDYNSLTFYFSAIDGSQAFKPIFQYRLQPYDQDWNLPTREAKVEYRNLPPGKFTFQIRAIGEANTWSEPNAYPLSIRPPWWLRWWAKVLYALMGIGLLALVRQFELKRRYQKQQKVIERARLEEKSKQAEKIKAQAEKLEQSFFELQKKNKEIIAARDQLIVQEKLASLGSLTAGISHEIKNPLNFITNFAEDSNELAAEILELITPVKEHLDQELFAELMELLSALQSNATVIENNGRKIDRIVHSMMDHARGRDQAWKQIDLNHLLDENANLAFHSFRANGQSFNLRSEKDYAVEPLMVTALPLQLGRVLLNIFTNACYALDQKKKKQPEHFEPLIQISTGESGGLAEVRIRDNGPGIPAKIRKEIFTPFFTTKPTGQGNTGLGLSISYDIIVKELGGLLEVDSEEGVFTEFRIVLPKERG